MLLAVECTSIVLTLKMSVVLHRDVGRNVFAVRPIGKISIVKYNYGSFVYKNLSSGGYSFKKYGESTMKVRKDTFLKWMNWPPEMAMDRNMVQHPVWMVPASFCAVRYMNDGR